LDWKGLNITVHRNDRFNVKGINYTKMGMDITKWRAPVVPLLRCLEQIHKAEGQMTRRTCIDHFQQVKMRAEKQNIILRSKTGLQATSAKYLWHKGNMKISTQNKEGLSVRKIIRIILSVRVSIHHVQ
jgi:hypothetical protein